MEISGQPQGKGRPRFTKKTGKAYTPEKQKNMKVVFKQQPGKLCKKQS